MFVLSGEHMDEFENFDTKAFVGRLLGKGDWTGFMDKIKVSSFCQHSVFGTVLAVNLTCSVSPVRVRLDGLVERHLPLCDSYTWLDLNSSQSLEIVEV